MELFEPGSAMEAGAKNMASPEWWNIVEARVEQMVREARVEELTKLSKRLTYPADAAVRSIVQDRLKKLEGER